MRRPLQCVLTALAACVCVSVSAASEQQDPKKQAFLTPEQAGADFAVQGEYVGEIETEDGKVKFGVQVIALGDGKFRGVAYRGGLPGDGWDGQEKKEADGQTKDGVTTFVGDEATGTLKDGKITVTNNDGREIGTLEKVLRKSPTLGKKPPEGAVVLFPMKADLSNVTLGEGEYLIVANFRPGGGRVDKTGLLMQGATSEQTFQDFTLHLEFLLSFMPHARGQERSNSGVYMQGRHEVQILDSFGLEGKHNECGGIYSVAAPAVNMCFPPLSWQTYDVDFTAARFDEGGKKVADARMTVRHNGVVIHDDVAVPKVTTAALVKTEGPEPGPIYIQDHGNPLRFRNIWVVPKK